MFIQSTLGNPFALGQHNERCGARHCHLSVSQFFFVLRERETKALEYKVGRVLAPSVESICCGFQNDISDLLIKLLYCELNKKNQSLKLIKYKI